MSEQNLRPLASARWAHQVLGLIGVPLAGHEEVFLLSHLGQCRFAHRPSKSMALIRQPEEVFAKHTTSSSELQPDCKTGSFHAGAEAVPSQLSDRICRTAWWNELS